MKLRNPRIFSPSLLVCVVVGTLTTAYISIALDSANDKQLLNLFEAAGLFLIHSTALALFAIVAGVIALFAGRLIGTKITGMLISILLLAVVIDSYREARPMSRFRRLVWQNAPQSLPIYSHEMHPTFNDGTTYLFTIGVRPETMEELCRAAKLTPVSETQLIRAYFERIRFPADTMRYGGGEFEVAYLPSDGKAFIVRSPILSRQPPPNQPSDAHNTQP
jgi:hypothetical protein